MTMSTPTLHEASCLLETVLIDLVQIMDVGDPVTVGIHVTRSLIPVGTSLASSPASAASSLRVGARRARTETRSLAAVGLGSVFRLTALSTTTVRQAAETSPARVFRNDLEPSRLLRVIVFFEPMS